MARKYGRILSSIWRDPDWRALSADAQRVFFLAISQPDLRLTGVVPYIPDRWAACAADTTSEAIETAVGELEAARFVVADTESHELLVRSFTRHELSGGDRQVAGMWSAWEEIWSDKIRIAVVDELVRLSDTPLDPLSDTPSVDKLWTKAPPEAKEIQHAGHRLSDTKCKPYPIPPDTEPEPVSDTHSIVARAGGIREPGEGNREKGTGNLYPRSVAGDETETGEYELVEPEPADPTVRQLADALDELCGKPPRDPPGLNRRRDDIRQLTAVFADHDIPPTADSVRTLAGLYRTDMTATLTAHALANHADRLIRQAANGALRRISTRDAEDATRQAEYAELVARKAHELEAEVT